jgi:hypothetical protein
MARFYGVASGDSAAQALAGRNKGNLWTRAHPAWDLFRE